MMFFCIGVQVLCLVGIWALLWFRNRSRRALHADVQTAELHVLAYERGLMDETDLQNKYFKVSISIKLWFFWLRLTMASVVRVLGRMFMNCD